jgi:hypothetical protein
VLPLKGYEHLMRNKTVLQLFPLILLQVPNSEDGDSRDRRIIRQETGENGEADRNHDEYSENNNYAQGPVVSLRQDISLRQNQYFEGTSSMIFGLMYYI